MILKLFSWRENKLFSSKTLQLLLANNCLKYCQKMGPLEQAKKAAAYKAVDDYVKVNNNTYFMIYLMLKVMRKYHDN